MPPLDFACGKRYLRDTEARYPSGKGEVCKTFMRGFDSHPRLQQFLRFRGLRLGPVRSEANLLEFVSLLSPHSRITVSLPLTRLT